MAILLVLCCFAGSSAAPICCEAISRACGQLGGMWCADVCGGLLLHKP